MTLRNWIENLFRKKPKLNKFGELLEVSEAQKASGISIINGRRCLHGLNAEQMDELNEPGMAMSLDEYKKSKGI